MSDPWFEIKIASGIKALQTLGQPDLDPYGKFNLALNVGDVAGKVEANRERLACQFGAPVFFPNQVHSADVYEVTCSNNVVIDADAVFTSCRGLPIGVLTADCLPILLTDGVCVAASHAGWKGLLSGIIENTIRAFGDRKLILAYLGPCISFTAFEVGPEVVDEFLDKYPFSKHYMSFARETDRAFIDIREVAVTILSNKKVRVVNRLDTCTVAASNSFYSYRRQAITGRMASCIMLS